MSKYFDIGSIDQPANSELSDANDINQVTVATASGFEQVESDVENVLTTGENTPIPDITPVSYSGLHYREKSKRWASGDQVTELPGNPVSGSGPSDDNGLAIDDGTGVAAQSSKYYSEQAALSETAAANSESNAAISESNAATSESNAANSALIAAGQNTLSAGDNVSIVTTGVGPYDFQVNSLETHSQLLSPDGLTSFALDNAGIFTTDMDGIDVSGPAIFKFNFKGDGAAINYPVLVTDTGTSSLAFQRYASAGDTYVSTLFKMNTTTGLVSLSTGASINEFSTDETLADDSDTAVPTEKAVKAYIDTSFSNMRSYCEVGTNSSFTAAASVPTKLPFNSLSTDLNSDWDAVNERFVAPEDGVYCIEGSVYLISLPISTQKQIRLYVDGVERPRLYTSKSGVGGDTIMRGSTTLYLTAGSYVELYYYVAASVTIGTGINLTRFVVSRVS